MTGCVFVLILLNKSWYTSAMYILQLLGLKLSSCTNLTLSHLVNIVKRKLIRKSTHLTGIKNGINM